MNGQSQAPAQVAHIKRILVPVDFSECGTHALHYAASLAKQVDASLVLLHVIDSLIAPPDMEFIHLNLKEFNAEREKRAKDKLAELARSVVDPTTPTTPVLRHGAPWEQIKETAREREIDLIVIGTHGYTGLKHVVLGSTAEKVVRLAGCPVLVVRDYGQSK